MATGGRGKLGVQGAVRVGVHGAVGVLLLLSLLECSCNVTQVNSTSNWTATIADAREGQTIRFKAGVYTEGCGVTLARSIRLEAAPGSHVRLDCKGQERHFVIDAGVQIEIEGLQLTNGKARSASLDGNGGCIHVKSGASLLIRRSNLTRSSADNQGGALYLAEGANLNVSDSTFGHCSATDRGGAVYSEGTLVISRCQFHDATADDDGGAIYARNSVITLTDSEIRGAVAGNDGGAIRLITDASLYARGLRIVGCSAADEGGGIYASTRCTLILLNTTLEGNTAADDGGGVRMATDTVLRATGLVIARCTAADDGGGIYASTRCTLIFSNSTLENNVAADNAGGLAISSHCLAQLDSSSVSFNSAGKQGGGITVGVHVGLLPSSNVQGDSSILLTSCSIDGNIARAGGGGISAYKDVSITLSGSVIRNNQGGEDYGGGIKLRDVTLRAERSMFLTNTAKYGGGVYATTGSTLEFKSSNVEFNSAGSHGGGIYISDSTLVVSNCSIAKNVAHSRAGGVYSDECSLAIINRSRVRGNWAGSLAGGILMTDSQLTVRQSSLEENTAQSGGGIYSFGGTINLLEGTGVRGNSAESKGGGLYVTAHTTLPSITFQKCLVTKNMAKYGGAVCAVAASIVVKQGTEVSHNVAITSGGAFWVGGKCEIKVQSGAVFHANIADSGGAVALSESALFASNSRFEGNKAVAGYGGAFSIAGIETVVEISGSLLSLNSAAKGAEGCSGCGGGGALAVSGAAKLTLSRGTQCTSNTASGDSRESSGGCILAWSSAQIRLENSSLVGNLAQDADGGGIALLQDSKLQISNSEIAKNEAHLRGGAIFIGPGYMGTGAAVLLLNSNALVSNIAKKGDGGAVFAYRMFGCAVGGTTRIELNSALQGRGGGVASYNSQLEIAHGHRLEFVSNQALSGGGIGLISGASISLTKETCAQDCKTTEALGNGICNPECFNRACMWDSGDCMPRLMSAGKDAAVACDRDKCSAYSQTSLKASACSQNCFTASCDWSRMSCIEPRKALSECALLDAVAFRSIKSAQRYQRDPIFMRDGNSEGFGRCDGNGCRQPVMGPNASSLMSAASKIGSACLQLDGKTAGWLSFWNTEKDGMTKLTGQSGFSLEAWLSPAESASWAEGSVAFVVASSNFALGILKHSNLMSLLAFQAGPSPAASCLEQRHLTSSSGVLSDGPLNEPRSILEGNHTCEWIIAPTGASKVTLIFTQLSLTATSFASTNIKVSACNNADCSDSTLLRRVYGHSMPAPLTSETGIMQVIFRTEHKSARASPGFTATYAASYPHVVVTHETWHHVAVSVGVDGLRQIFINASLLQADYWDWDVPQAAPFDRGTASIGRRGAFWQDKSFAYDEGFFYGKIDEMKVWKTVRAPADLQANMLHGCSSPEMQSKTGTEIVACFSFDAAREGDTSFSDEASRPDEVTMHLQTRSGLSPFMPYCVGMDDDGKAPADDGDELWGFCQDQPRLPGAGYHYDVTDMERTASLARDSVEVLIDHQGCGDTPLIFSQNRARENGGAMYYDSCQGLDDWNDCFLQLSTDRASSFKGNTAGSSGGGIFVECYKMGKKCLQSLSSANTLGSLLLPKAEFRQNSAGSYGARIATQARRMSWSSTRSSVSTCPLSVADCRQLATGLLYELVSDGDYATKGCFCYSAGTYAKQCFYGTINGQQLSSASQLNCPDHASGQSRPYTCPAGCGASTPGRTFPLELEQIPGQDALSLDIRLYDDTDSLVRGTGDVVEVRFCRISGTCSTKDAIMPSAYFGFSQSTGVATVEARLECPVGEDAARFEVVLVGSPFVPLLHGRVSCSECQAGQKKSSRTVGSVAGTWWCDKCLPMTYIIDRLGPCQPCPKGAECPDGVQFAPTTNGSKWISTNGFYRVQECPEGYSLYREAQFPLNDNCVRCEKSTYTVQRAGPGSSGCLPCPKGGDCLGANQVLAVDGYWRLEYKYDAGFEYLPARQGPQCQKEGQVCLFPPGTILLKVLVPSTLWEAPLICTNVSTRGLVCARPQNQAVRRSASASSSSSSASPSSAATSSSTSSSSSSSSSSSTASLPSNTSQPKEALTARILRCHHAGACARGNHCLQNRTGPLCGVCAAGFAMTTSGCSAKACPSEAALSGWRTVFALSVSTVATVLYVLLSWRHVFPQADWIFARIFQAIAGIAGGVEETMTQQGAADDANACYVCIRSGFATLKLLLSGLSYITTATIKMFRKIFQGKASQFFKIFVTFFQILSSFTMFSVRWPDGLLKIITWAKSLKLDVVQLPGLSCLWHGISFRSSLLAYTIGPLVVLGAMLLPVVVSFCLGQHKHDPQRLRMTLDSFWGNAMFLFFVLYPAISVAVMNAFDCDVQLGLLKADYAELCPTIGSYLGMHSAFFFFLYPIGIPVAVVLVIRKEGIKKIVQERLTLAKFEAMIAVYIRTSCSTESHRFANLVGETDNLDEFNRQADMVFEMLLRRQGLEGERTLIIDTLENSSLDMGLDGTSIREICSFLRSFDANSDGRVDMQEFKVMLQTARAAANVFAGTEKSENLSDQQLDALLLYEWPQQEEGVTDVDSAGGLGGFIEQLKKEQSIMIVSTLQEEKAQHDREDRRSKMDAGDRSDPPLVALDELEQELSELHQSGALNHYPAWKIDLIEAENTYVDSPEAETICMCRIRVKRLTYQQKQEQVVELAETLYAAGITAIPAQVWNESEENVAEQRIVRRLGFVLVAYRVEYWWWEALEMLRKFLMTSLLIFVYPDDPAQMAAGLFITFCFLLANMTFQPFATPSLNTLQSFSMVAQFLTLFVGIMMAFTEKQEQDNHLTNTAGTDRAIVSVLIVLINGTMMLFPVLQLFLNGGLQDYYQQVLSLLDSLFHLITCGRYRRQEPILKTQSLKSRLTPEEDGSDDDKGASEFANRDFWGLSVLQKKNAHAPMPVIVQKARALTSWRNATVFKKRFTEEDCRGPAGCYPKAVPKSPLLAPAVLPRVSFKNQALMCNEDAGKARQSQQANTHGSHVKSNQPASFDIATGLKPAGVGPHLVGFGLEDHIKDPDGECKGSASPLKLGAYIGSFTRHGAGASSAAHSNGLTEPIEPRVNWTRRLAGVKYAPKSQIPVPPPAPPDDFNDGPPATDRQFARVGQ